MRRGGSGGALALSGVLPADSAGRPDATRPCLAHELEPGQAYAVVLTTGGGLYRYQLGDVVTVLGRIHQCPLVRFAGRNEVADWCGEKLHEVQAARIIESAFTAHRLTPSFAMLACDTSGDVPHYGLYVEAAASKTTLVASPPDFDRALDENFHYRLRAAWVNLARSAHSPPAMPRRRIWPPAWPGSRAGDVKRVALDRRDGWTPKFQGHFAGV